MSRPISSSTAAIPTPPDVSCSTNASVKCSAAVGAAVGYHATLPPWIEVYGFPLRIGVIEKTAAGGGLGLILAWIMYRWARRGR